MADEPPVRHAQLDAVPVVGESGRTPIWPSASMTIP